MPRPYGTTKWRSKMTADEAEWFAACPKAVLFEIAKSFAMLQSEGDEAKAFELLQGEWSALNMNGIVPQKPFKIGRHGVRDAKEAEKLKKQRVFWAKQVIGSPDREAIFTRQFGATPQSVLNEG